MSEQSAAPQTDVETLAVAVVELRPALEAILMVSDEPLDTVRLDELGNIEVEPGQQVEIPPGAVFEPGNGTLTFTPGEGAPVERFSPGEHRATVIYWKVEEGPERGRSWTWSFTVV